MRDISRNRLPHAFIRNSDLVAGGDVRIISSKKKKKERNVGCYSNPFIMIYSINTQINLQDAR